MPRKSTRGESTPVNPVVRHKEFEGRVRRGDRARFSQSNAFNHTKLHRTRGDAEEGKGAQSNSNTHKTRMTRCGSLTFAVGDARVGREIVFVRGPVPLSSVRSALRRERSERKERGSRVDGNDLTGGGFRDGAQTWLATGIAGKTTHPVARNDISPPPKKKNTHTHTLREVTSCHEPRRAIRPVHRFHCACSRSPPLAQGRS